MSYTLTIVVVDEESKISLDIKKKWLGSPYDVVSFKPGFNCAVRNGDYVFLLDSKDKLDRLVIKGANSSNSINSSGVCVYGGPPHSLFFGDENITERWEEVAQLKGRSGAQVATGRKLNSSSSCS